MHASMATKVEPKPVFPAEPLMPKPKQTRPNKQLRPPTASRASPDWWPKSCLLHSTSQVSERLTPVDQRKLGRFFGFDCFHLYFDAIRTQSPARV